jgi:tRNA-splicing ligase RtcB (3'-phosphate/5'-hydroxy nucleic acid ligase)
MSDFSPLEKLDTYRWKLPRSYKPGMRVDGIIYSSEKLLPDIIKDKAMDQVANAAFLPGIVRNSLAMPDIHWGYGLPIGGVVATDPKAGGVVTPGGIGFDINCGVRIMRTNLRHDDINKYLEKLVDALYAKIPAGVGSTGDIVINKKDEKELMVKGSAWCLGRGYASREDIECTEDGGCLAGADPDKVSDRAYERGSDQVGTLGSGNHFVEIQAVDEIYDEQAARQCGLEIGSVTVMIHSGSRGLGYQVCEEYSKSMLQALSKYNITVPDRQLACAPLDSPEARNYLGAMNCAANYAWANRQCLMFLTRRIFERIFGQGEKSLGLDLIYDVAHNIGKFEKGLFIHRKGATRAFGPGNDALPEKYKNTGQPVIIPGDMGRNSYLLLGTRKAEDETFASTCHGAGRVMSRSAAVRSAHGRRIDKELLQEKGIIVRSTGRETMAEEMPEAYRDINDVIDVVSGAGIARKVCRMKPLGVVKG